MSTDKTPLERFATPRALEHWRWTEARRARFRDQDCACELCEVMARLAAASDETEAPDAATSEGETARQDLIDRARRVANTFDTIDGSEHGHHRYRSDCEREIERWSDGQAFTTDDLRALAALAALGITVSDEPEAPGDVIERARATVERSMGRAWTDEGEYANLPEQAAHDLAAAGLLRTEGVSAESGHRDTAERIAQAIEAVLSLSPRRSLTAAGLLRAARIAREVGEVGR